MDGSGKGWWRASDGHWYPPGMARHPAARREAKPPEPAVAADGRRSRHVWAVLIAPIVVMVALAYGLVATTSSTGSVRTGSPNSTSLGSIDELPAPTTSVTMDPVNPEDPNPTDQPSSPPPLTSPMADPPGASPASGTGPPTVGPPLAGQATTAPPHRMPTSVASCKASGWANLVDDHGQPFRNQGQCVSFANHN